MNQKPSPLHRASEWIVDHYRLFFVVFAALLVFSAVASGWVKVENDVAAYLPADSETRQGLDIMEQEFQTYGSAKILLRDTDADAAAATAEQIHAVDGVDSCTYTMNDTGSALLSVSLSDLEGSDTCAQTVQALRDLLDGSGAYIYSAEGYSISDQINGEVRGLLVIVAIILVTVLTFTSSTYAEVPILLITFLAAALINKGTNFVFGTISFVSNAVAILLQLAMSVDYAIIFCNRYKQAHETLPVREAAIESLEKSITVISSSSLTTIAGLVAMTFMKFGLGRDLGIVLIKAILISMLTVFLLMPGLLLKLGPAMDKTKHRNFVPKISGVGRLAWRTRRVVPLVFAAVLVVACIGANRVSYVYSEAPLKTHNADVNRTASQAITDDFGDETVLAVVVPAGDYTQEAALLDALSALPEVKSAVGIAGTEAAGGYRLADAVDYRTFAQLSDVDSSSAPARSSRARRTIVSCSRLPRPRTGTRRLLCSTASTPSCTSTTPPTAISSATPCPPTGPSKRSRRTTSWSAPCPSSWSCSCCCSRSARSVCPFCSRSSFRAASGSTSASRCSRASMCSSWSISWPAPFRWAATWTMRSSSPRTIPRRAPIRARARP